MTRRSEGNAGHRRFIRSDLLDWRALRSHLWRRSTLELSSGGTVGALVGEAITKWRKWIDCSGCRGDNEFRVKTRRWEGVEGYEGCCDGECETQEEGAGKHGKKITDWEEEGGGVEGSPGTHLAGGGDATARQIDTQWKQLWNKKKAIVQSQHK